MYGSHRAGSVGNPILIILLLLFSVPVHSGAEKPGPPEILIIHSYHPSFDWTLTQHDGLVEVLESWPRVYNLSLEYMDTKRISTREHLDGLKTLYAAKYGRTPPDIIIATDTNAFSLLYNHRQEIFGEDVPVVFSGVNHFEPADWPNLVNYVGVDERMDLEAGIELIDTLHPGHSAIAVVTDDTVTGEAIRREVLDWEESRGNPGRFNILDFQSRESIITEISEMPDDGVVFYTLYARDGGGVTYQPEELLELIVRESDLPVYGPFSFLVPKGIIGGPIISGTELGRQAAALAIEILEGRRDPGIFHLEDCPVEITFDRRVMKKHGIRVSRVPPDSILVNSPLPPWKSYPVITGLAAALLATMAAALIFVLHLLGLRNRLVAEIAQLNEVLEDRVIRRSEQLARAESELMRSEKLAALGSLVAGVAHEVNTPLGLGITGSSYLKDRFNALKRTCDNGDLSMAELAEFLSDGSEMSRMIETNLVRAGNQIRTFKQVAVDQSGESPRAVNMAEMISDFILSMESEIRKSNITVEVSCPEHITITHYPGDLWRILANLLMNSQKHGFPTGENGTIEIEVSRHGDSIEIIYRDDGRGIPEANLGKIFNPYFTTARNRGGTGLGLHLVRSIIEDRHGGRIRAANRPSGGMEFIITLPEESPVLHREQKDNPD